MRVAGIMSGTSLDGIDVAVVDIGGRGWRMVEFLTVPYPGKVRQAILAVSNTNCHTADISRLNFLLGELYARAMRKLRTRLGSIGLIGCHGQTIFHDTGNTLQIGEGSVIAERTGIPVVCDFRPRDIAAGGKGAPLVPYVDYLLFRHPKRTRVALNIGGIANITCVPANCDRPAVVAFDTGPGNMVVDALAEIATRRRWKFDKDGALAAAGRVHSDLLRVLLAERYYRRPPPKTAGREQYGREFVARLLATNLPINDLIATATALTAAAVVVGIERFSPAPADELIVSGGGVHNPRMMAYLASFLPRTRVLTSADFGIDPDAKEAIAFAVLAHETWRGRPGNLPSATGARRPVVLGKICSA